VISRLLLAVDDSVDSLAAARAAVELARQPGRVLRAVHVSLDGALDEALRSASSRPGAEARRGRSDAAVLTRVRGLAAAAGVEVDTALLSGDVGRALLDDARAWRADLVVVGKSARSASGAPYVGTVTRHVLEFSEQPVLVVPPAAAGRLR
jgi:nucleotide-binding universal stress UspA family protein